MKIQTAVVVLTLGYGLLSLCLAQDPQLQVPPSAVPAGKVMSVSGTVTATRAGIVAGVPLKAGDPVYRGDRISTNDASRVFVLFTDNTIRIQLAADTELTIDEYDYDPNPNAHNRMRYSLLKGALDYTNGVIGKAEEPDVQIDTPVGTIADRGTYFICQYDTTTKTLGVYLSIGSLDFTAKTAGAVPTKVDQGPAWLKVGASGPWVLAYTQDQYDYLESQLFAGQKAAAAVGTPQTGNVSNFQFVSCSGALTSEQLFDAYNSLYLGSTTFKGLMDQIGGEVFVVVVNGKVGLGVTFQDVAKAGYANLNGNSKGSGLATPPTGDYAFTFLRNGVITVVISAQALQNNSYATGWRLPPAGSSIGTPSVPTGNKESVQQTLAYELGENAFGYSQNGSYTEHPDESRTNQIMQDLAKTKNLKFVANATKDMKNGGQIMSGADYVDPNLKNHDVSDFAGNKFISGSPKDPTTANVIYSSTGKASPNFTEPCPSSPVQP
jgi:hypothetical protein